MRARSVARAIALALFLMPCLSAFGGTTHDLQRCGVKVTADFGPYFESCTGRAPAASKAVIYLLPGSEGVADELGLHIVTQFDSAQFRAFGELLEDYVVVTSATSEYPRVDYCRYSLNQDVRDEDDYWRKCMHKEVFKTFRWEDAERQAIQGYRAASELARSLSKPLLILSISNGCYHVAALQREGVLNGEPLLLMSCSGYSGGMTYALQESSWRNVAVLESLGKDISLAGLERMNKAGSADSDFASDTLIAVVRKYVDARIVATTPDGTWEAVRREVGLQLCRQARIGMRAEPVTPDIALPELRRHQLIMDGDKCREILQNQTEPFVNEGYSHGPLYLVDWLSLPRPNSSLATYPGRKYYVSSRVDTLVPVLDKYCAGGDGACWDAAMKDCGHGLGSDSQVCVAEFRGVFEKALGTLLALPPGASVLDADAGGRSTH